MYEYLHGHAEVGLDLLCQRFRGQRGAIILPLGLPAGHRHHSATKSFGAVVGAEATGEQPLAIGYVSDVPWSAAGRVY